MSQTVYEQDRGSESWERRMVTLAKGGDRRATEALLQEYEGARVGSRFP